jgi:hypothetical protein
LVDQKLNEARAKRLAAFNVLPNGSTFNVAGAQQPAIFIAMGTS